MRKERTLKGKGKKANWTNLRTEISKAITNNRLLESEFRPLTMYEDWKEIEEKIYQKFCNINHPKHRHTWLWEHFKLETFIYSKLENIPEFYLDKLVEQNETVWYFVNETINERVKFWFYEGTIKSIQKIINETWFVELYVVSKKYEWLICINHHDKLIVTGDCMQEKMKKFQLEYGEKNVC